MPYMPYQPVTERPHRRRRWAWAIGMGMMFALSLPALALFVPGGASRPSSILISAFLPLIVTLPQSPFARGGGRFRNRNLPPLDEFELAAITAGTRRAYHSVIAILGALFVWLSIASGIPGAIVPHTSWQWTALGVSLVVIVVALPVFFAELMVPMPPANDPEAEEL